MFPLNWNIPFIRKNGSRTTLGAITGDIAGIEEDVADLAEKTDGLWDNMSENGRVNYCKNNATTTTTSDGTTTFTWTVNDDKSITFSAPSYPVTLASHQTLNIWYNVSADECKELVGKTFKLTGCPSGGGADSFKVSAYRAQTADGSSGTPEDYGEGKEFTWHNNASGTKAIISVVVRNGYTVTESITFKPMLSLASLNLSYDDYVPYAKSNQELSNYTSILNGNINSVKGGTLQIEFTAMTANVEQEIISSEGMYLLFIDSSVADRCCAYMVHVHYSDTNGSIQVPIYVGNDITISFDASVVKKLSMTADKNCRVRTIKLSNANY